MGFCVVIFPKARAFHTASEANIKVGGALLSASTGVPVVPIAKHNAGKLWGRNSIMKHRA